MTPSAVSDFDVLVTMAVEQMATGQPFDWEAVGGEAALRALHHAAVYATDRPEVLVNRARMAALTDYGYAQMDRYDRWQPTIFAASAAVCALSVAQGIRRRRRSWETVAFYALSATLSGGLAWLTRPDALRPAPAPLPPAGGAGAPGDQQPDSMAGAFGWLDRRIAYLDATRPGWEKVTWQRLAHDLGYPSLDPAIEDLLLRRAR